MHFTIPIIFLLLLTTPTSGRRCTETLSLTDREDHAETVFTGTVQKIYRKSPNHNSLQEYNGMVMVKRVLKGDRQFQNNNVVVGGLGNREMCQSDVKEGDTRIFLVVGTESGYLRLNSSLLRMSMHNLDIISAAVNDIPYKRRPNIQDKPCELMYCSFGAECLVDELTQQGYCKCQDACSEIFAPVCGSDGVGYTSECQLRMASCSQQIKIYVKHHGQCDVKDPCENNECRFGAHCKPLLDGVTFECVCPEKCSAYGNSRSSRPVCGTDGKDYPNMCELKKISCKDMRTLEVRFTGRCDPCQGVECPNDQVCQLDDSRNAICRCNAGCSEDPRPVCGSDGKTYGNECSLRVEACKFRKNIRVVYGGECSAGKNPCENIVCGPYEDCNIDKFGIASCQCQPSCESVMKPVCGSNGQTYSNECELQRNACMMKRHVSVVYKGACGDTGPCHNYVCSFGALCVLKNNHPGCECPTCTERFEPVCGTDGISYTNDCKMKREACAQRKDISIAYMGLCNTCSQTQCEYYATCELDSKGRATCVCTQSCVKIEAKVCGNDGVTYQNECELRVAACTKQQYITVASRGPCDLCINVHCKYGARCEDGRCVCPTECPDNPEPVCSSDGTTYRSDCEMRRAACVHTQDLSVLFYGECEDIGGSGAGSKSPESGSGNYACEEDPCRFGGICDYDSEGNPQCVCPFECPAVKEPVCGSDGQFYDSDCVMKEKACKTQKKIVIVPKNRCQKRVEVACDGEAPLINPVSGTDYFCGDGPDFKQCPPSSYCHKTAEFAKCCKEVIVIKSCLDTVHGCCPDGKTTAQGPEQAGCPSHCNCNRLGSYSLTCDPVSQQCPCKPGVGGLHCERCEPGFWGLHKISEGSGGCTPCDCDPHGSVRDDCEQMTGRCVCRQGIKGMKCNICPAGTVLGSGGCVDASIAKAVTGSCDELECFHGAKCKEKHGEVQCVCDFKCTREDRDAKTPEDHTVCGTDGNSYGSECQLRQFSCRYQKRIEVAGEGPCSKLNISQFTFYSTTTMASVRRSTETTTLRPTTAVEVKIVREATEGHLENLLLTPKSALDFSTPASANTIGLPLFSGKSYLELSKLEAYSRLAIELEIRTLANNGIILYNGQTASGRGDYVSLAIKDGFVEFKYDLGSGVVVLRSSQRLQLGRFHRITAKRYQRDGMLSVDGQDQATGHSSGPKNFLDLGQHLYLGYVPGSVEQIFENIGIAVGFNGCIRHFKIGRQYVDLKYPGSKVLKAVDINECSDDSCASMPCLNGASCILSDEQDYTCKCAASFTGKHCEHQLDSCASDPCSYGATCLLLSENKFSCLCPPGSSGEFCELVSTEGDESGITLEFKGESYLEFPTLPNAAHSLTVEMWFMTRSPNGLLLYNGQKPGGVGDFVALTLLNGFLHFTFNLGSGTANIASIQPVSIGVWHSVKISRLRSRGMLQVDDGPVITGESKGTLTELNLGQPLYIGGVPEFLPLKYSLVVQLGLDGAVQRIAVNDEVWEDALSLSTGQGNIELYSGPPCLPDICRNGGRCIPVLEDFRCQCVDGFSGKWCNKTEEVLEMSDNVFNQPVKFEGNTFLPFSDATRGRKLKKSKENYITITFRTTREYGLLLWMNKGPSVRGDYLAMAIVKGRIELSFNLGKEITLLFMKSTIKVNDNKWHTVTIKRNKRLAHLIVDNSHPITSTSQPGATELNTDGILWIGGSSTVPSGFPDTFYKGFTGCISSVTVDGESLNLSDGYFNYCQPS